MNINAVPNSKDFNLQKWQHYFEATPFSFFDTSEEGQVYSDANTIAKVLDMSLTSDIKQYIELAEYIRSLAGKAIGVSDPNGRTNSRKRSSRKCKECFSS